MCPSCEVIELFVGYFPWFENLWPVGSMSQNISSLISLWVYVARFQVCDLFVALFSSMWGLWLDYGCLLQDWDLWFVYGYLSQVARSLICLWLYISRCQVCIPIQHIYPAGKVSRLFVVSCCRIQGLWSLFGCVSYMRSVICLLVNITVCECLFCVYLSRMWGLIQHVPDCKVPNLLVGLCLRMFLSAVCVCMSQVWRFDLLGVYFAVCGAPDIFVGIHPIMSGPCSLWVCMSQMVSSLMCLWV